MDIARRAALCAVLYGASLGASAADQGWYFGALGGRAEYQFEPWTFVPLSTPDPVIGPAPILRPPPGGLIGGVLNPIAPFAVFTPLSWSPEADDEASAYGLFVGYRIMKYAAVELSYLNLGTLEHTQTLSVPIPSGATITSRRELETSGPSLSLLGLAPIGAHVELFVRAGVLFADAEARSRTTSASVNVVGSGFSTTFGSEALQFGGGLQFNWGAHWTARLDFQRFQNVGEKRESGQADIDLFALNLMYRL